MTKLTQDQWNHARELYDCVYMSCGDLGAEIRVTVDSHLVVVQLCGSNGSCGEAFPTRVLDFAPALEPGKYEEMRREFSHMAELMRRRMLQG